MFLAASTAGAWTPTPKQLNQKRWSTLELRGDYCRSTWKPRPLSEIPASHLDDAWRWWSNKKALTKEKGSRCGPAAIIRDVFPSYAEDQALRVAGCESTGTPYHLNPYAKNQSSTASGLFQLLSTWWAGKFDPFDARANTRMAYQLWLGSGGSFARHWAASIGCWG